MPQGINPAIRLVFLSLLLLPLWRAQASVSVIIQPGDQTVSVGETVIFGATAIATAGEVVESYQWFMSTNNQNFVPVADTAGLIITNVQTTNSGYYFATVTYQPQSGGRDQSVSSPTVTLAVNLQPQIVAQPVSLTLPVGANALFTASAGGAPPLHFQWQQNGTNLADNARLTGSTTTNLLIQNLALADSGNYDVVVDNSYGSATSQVAALDVFLALPVFTSPTNAVGKQGYAFNYTVTATGTAPISFGVTGLPDGLSFDPTNDVISGIPSVAGVFDIGLFATNVVQTTAAMLVLTLADDIPVITSATNAVGKQGQPFSYTISATNDPVVFEALSLPDGLSVDTNSGIISGVPLVSGSFPIAIGAANTYGSDTETLTLNLASGAPFIISSLVKNGMQGQPLAYTIITSNNAALFSAAPLPAGLNLNATNGVVSGVPLLSGSLPVTIGAMNQFGSDSQTLTLNLASAIPVITSPLNITSVEEQLNFNYTITATNSPTALWASDLPTGLAMDTNSGAITGFPLYAGNYTIPLFAANAWGVGTANLQLTVTNMVITNLLVTNLMTNYMSPYLVQFTFSLLNGDDPLTSHAVVASPNLMSETAFEDGVPVSPPPDTSVILHPLQSQNARTLQGFLVMDFSESIASFDNGDTNGTGVSDAVYAEVASAQSYVNQQPAGSQIGVFEFHRDDEAPQEVLPLTTDKTLLDNSIAGIWNNYVQDFPAGARLYDALGAAISALGPANTNAIHYILLMSDGQDTSSTNTMTNVIAAANQAGVRIYTVGFGDDLDTNVLDTISSSTLGQFFAPTNLAVLTLDFARLGKDLSSQYVLRWATLERTATPFMPSFQITYQGLTADSPPNPPPFISGTNYMLDTNTVPATTNEVFLYTTNYIIPPYTPTVYAGNVLAGSLLLSSNANANPLQVTLSAAYVPRYIREFHLHYRANWPVTVTLDSTNPGEMLYGWTLTETNDGAGGQWALLSAPDPSLLADSIPFADFGNLLTFSFQDPTAVASNAFSEFEVDNTIYTNSTDTNFYGFTLANTNAFTTVYPILPPHGTPIPWLISYGFTSDFAAAELLDPDGNGFDVWQDYLAGLDPLEPASTFAVQIAPSPLPPQIVFSTVAGRTYRIDWAPSPDGVWTVLRDGIAGTGGNVVFTDLRNLSTVSAMYYRVVVEGP
ncbi:MAG TPA: putative Ig domain-containing protein [Verrucomicrobiae bacterium]|nr:putative Ig domain-containing protein [Verrucomicrobiae bacterium]